jgi:hypothetical protein
MKKLVKKQTGGSTRPKNVQRTSGSQPLSEYSPKINKGSGNLIPVGATKNPKTGKPLKPAVKKTGGAVRGKKK